MHNIEHERRPTNTPKLTSTLFKPLWIVEMGILPQTAFVCVQVCVDTNGSSKLYTGAVQQFWLLSDFKVRKMGRELCNWKQQSKMVKEHSGEYFEDQ